MEKQQEKEALDHTGRTSGWKNNTYKRLCEKGTRIAEYAAWLVEQSL